MNRSRRFPSRGGAGALFFGSLALMLVGIGCGGSSDSKSTDGGAGTTGAAGTSGSAGTGGPASGATMGVDGCKALVQSLCTRDRDCNVPDAGADEISTCQTQNVVDFGCDRGAGLDFGECISDVRVVSCTTLFSTPPQSCINVLNQIPETVPAMKCDMFAQTVCERSAACSATPMTPDDVTACAQDLSSNIGCTFATGVGPTFDQCLTDVKNLPCPAADAGATPADAGSSLPNCDTAITFPMN